MPWWQYQPYVSVAKRRKNAAKVAQRLGKRGEKLAPVSIAGRAIAASFWGKAWCDHLESYQDFENRLPRGRSYVRNGSVVDLKIEAGRIVARVSGSSLYTVEVKIKPLAKAHWTRIRERCAGHVGSLIELLKGRLSEKVMGIVTHRSEGLFPKPAEIDLDCSCPDWATMCKHVAAVLYGVGARLDTQPELLFALRQVNHEELIAQATDMEIARGKSKKGKTIAEDALGEVFGIEIDAQDVVRTKKRKATPVKARAAVKRKK